MQNIKMVKSDCSTHHPLALVSYLFSVCKPKLEVLAAFVHGARRNALVIIICWPGSAAISNALFEDLDDVIERSLTFACPIAILGDVDNHLDALNDPHTVRFKSMIDS